MNCRTKVKNGQWNEIDCEFDKETIRCCNYECGNRQFGLKCEKNVQFKKG